MIEITNDIYEILYLGPKGTYSEIAKNQFKYLIPNKNIIETPFPTVKSIIEYVQENENSVAVIPIENSIEGIVRETMDNLLNVSDNELQITAETVIPIDHCLVSKSKDIKNIKKVISHPQALAQCQRFIENNLGKNIERTEKSSTSKAAQELQTLDE